MFCNICLPILSFSTFGSTGKTTLLVKLLAVLRRQGYRVGVVKYAHPGTFIFCLPGSSGAYCAGWNKPIQ